MNGYYAARVISIWPMAAFIAAVFWVNKVGSRLDTAVFPAFTPDLQLLGLSLVISLGAALQAYIYRRTNYQIYTAALVALMATITFVQGLRVAPITNIELIAMVTFPSVTLIILLLAMSEPKHFRKVHLRRLQSRSHGGADFANRRDLKKYLNKWQGLHLGAYPNKDFLSTKDDIFWNDTGSLITIGPSGQGKGRAAVINALMNWEGNCFTIDVKGELAHITAFHRRGYGHRTIILAPKSTPPFNHHSDKINPLDLLGDPEQNPDTYTRYLNQIVDAFIPKEGTGGASLHFYETAKIVFRGLVAYVHDPKTPPAPNLASVYEMLQMPPLQFDAWADNTIADPTIGAGYPRIAANMWRRIAAEEKGSLYSTLARHVACLRDPDVQYFLSESTFNLALFPVRGWDIYLSISHLDLAELGRILRLVTNLSITAVTLAPKPPEKDILFLLDEMPVIGGLQSILDPETGTGALTLARTYKVKFWGFLQSPAQLEKAYGAAGKKIWMDSIRVLQILDCSMANSETAEEISKLTGETTIAVSSHGPNGPTSAEKGRRLMTPEEVRNMREKDQLLFVKGCPYPILAELVYYDQVPVWKNRHLKNPLVDAPQPYAIDPEIFEARKTEIHERNRQWAKRRIEKDTETKHSLA